MDSVFECAINPLEHDISFMSFHSMTKLLASLRSYGTRRTELHFVSSFLPLETYKWAYVIQHWIIKESIYKLIIKKIDYRNKFISFLPLV